MPLRDIAPGADASTDSRFDKATGELKVNWTHAQKLNGTHRASIDIPLGKSSVAPKEADAAAATHMQRSYRPPDPHVQTLRAVKFHYGQYHQQTQKPKMVCCTENTNTCITRAIGGNQRAVKP